MMWKIVLVGIVLGIDLVNACLPGTGFGLGYPAYPNYSPYSYSYNSYPASYGVPFKSRHESTEDTKTPLLASTDETNGCVTKFENSRLTCATSFERRPLSTELDCQKLCFENILKCQSFEFNSLTATCDLYNVPPPEGVLVAAKRNPKSPFADEPIKDKDDYSYRKRFRRQLTLFDQQDPLKLPQFPNYCEPEVVPSVGSMFFVPNLECTPSNTFSESIEPFSNRHQRLPNSVSSVVPTPGTHVIPEMTDCRDGGKARIQLIDGIAFVPEKNPVAKIQLDSPDVCLLLCRNNAYLDGTRFQRPCASAAFDRGSGRCTIMDEAISPNGQLQYTPHADSVYFEKMCIPVAELPMNCDDVVHRIPQRVLDGQADATVDAANQVDCIRRCITASRLLGFICQSATYYFEFPSQNCILNRFTRLSKPDFFAAELRQKVDYMELAPCMISGWQQRDAAWSEWSDCSKTLIKTRKRNCTDCDKKEETVPCVTSSGFQEEFPVITKDIESDLVPVPKIIANDFDSVKKMQKHKLPEDEKSLFGEQDYDNQKEVSYFGPPRTEQKNDFLDGNKIEDITSDAINELELAAMKEAESVDEIDRKIEKERKSEIKLDHNLDKKYPNLGEGVGVVEYGNDKHETTPSSFEGSYGNSHADQLGEKQIGIQTVELGPIAATDSLQNCDPTKDCCPLIDLSGRKSRGCTLGFKINKNHQQEGCVPDDCKHKTPIGFRFYI